MTTITTRVEGPNQRIIHLNNHTAAPYVLMENWPLPILEHPECPNLFGVLFGTQDFELGAYTFPLPEMGYEEACELGTALAGLVATGAARLARAGCQGTILPVVYLRETADFRFETGVAVFCDEISFLLCIDFILTLPTSIPGVSLPPVPPPADSWGQEGYAALGEVYLETAIINGELVLLSEEMPDPEDLVWAALTEPGTEVEVAHVRCAPVALDLTVDEIMEGLGYGEA
jgi:hypothetical protein